ncbi:hypothetical protein FOCC_FOCC003918 [Frankliniella occidentalis]|nr:hypothetical protein FOCC_FOCC003918 [Frankliniella occidentalis]
MPAPPNALSHRERPELAEARQQQQRRYERDVSQFKAKEKEREQERRERWLARHRLLGSPGRGSASRLGYRLNGNPRCGVPLGHGAPAQQVPSASASFTSSSALSSSSRCSRGLALVPWGRANNSVVMLVEVYMGPTGTSRFAALPRAARSPTVARNTPAASTTSTPKASPSPPRAVPTRTYPTYRVFAVPRTVTPTHNCGMDHGHPVAAHPAHPAHPIPHRQAPGGRARPARSCTSQPLSKNLSTREDHVDVDAAGGAGLIVDGRVDAFDGEGQVGGGVSRDDEEQAGAGAQGLLLGRVAMHVLWHFRQTGTFSPDVPERMGPFDY